jgi:Cytochrome P460
VRSLRQIGKHAFEMKTLLRRYAIQFTRNPWMDWRHRGRHSKTLQLITEGQDEDWQVVAVSQTDDLLKAMVANPTMIAAYKSGVPGNGKSFPDGSKIVKIEWKPKKSTEAPFSVRIPDVLQDVFLIEKDSKKYPGTKGWAYAAFDYDRASDTFVPDKTGTVTCGFACHTRVANKDYIFTEYGKR